MKTGIEILDKYSKFFNYSLAKRGLAADPDEVGGELAEVYASCLNTYDPENNAGVCFDTYVINAFKYRVKKIERNLRRDREHLISMSLLRSESNIEEDINFEENTPSNDEPPSDRILFNSLALEIFNKLKTGRSIVILNEMINPSKKVSDTINVLMQHYEDTPFSKRIQRGNGIFRKAIELVYGYNSESVRYNVECIKNIAKMMLTN